MTENLLGNQVKPESDPRSAGWSRFASQTPEDLIPDQRSWMLLRCSASSSLRAGSVRFGSPSMEKMKSLAVWISRARWSSYSRWSCLLNSWMSRFRSSMRAADLKSSSGPEPPWGSLPAAEDVGLFPRLPAEPGRPESAGAAMVPACGFSLQLVPLPLGCSGPSQTEPNRTKHKHWKQLRRLHNKSPTHRKNHFITKTD